MKNAPPKKQSMSKIILWVVVAVAVVGLGWLLLMPKGGSGLTKVDSAGLLAAQAKGAQIVDVRTSGEYALGHIKGSINVPVEEIAQTAANWNKDSAYVLYCASGARSADAQQTLGGMGFKSVADLTGGVGSWTGPLEKGASTSQQTIPTSGKPVFIEFYTPT
jgi:rhodanese-related sulfurtransferase